MHFNTYVNHRETRPINDIMLYFGCLACDSHMIFPHLPEHVMWKLDYTRTILKHPVVYAPLVMTHRDMHDMFVSYLSHLIPEKAQSTIVESN